MEQQENTGTPLVPETQMVVQVMVWNICLFLPQFLEDSHLTNIFEVGTIN